MGRSKPPPLEYTSDINTDLNFLETRLQGLQRSVFILGKERSQQQDVDLEWISMIGCTHNLAVKTLQGVRGYSGSSTTAKKAFWALLY